LLVLASCGTQSEHAAGDDRPVPPRGGELVERLDQQRWLKAVGAGTLAAELDHVGRDVAAVDVVTGLPPRDQQPAGAAAGGEGRLPRGDEAAEVLDLRAAGVERRPPLSNEPVVPSSRWRAGRPSFVRIHDLGFSSYTNDAPGVCRVERLIF